jgi:methionine--tRNA ligase beta chain
MSDQIDFDTFKKVELRMGKVLAADRVEGSEKLVRYDVDFGEMGQRQILSGIAKWYSPEGLVGKILPFVVNLEPRQIMGLESQGMLLATGNEDGAVLLEPVGDVDPGAEIV